MTRNPLITVLAFGLLTLAACSKPVPAPAAVEATAPATAASLPSHPDQEAHGVIQIPAPLRLAAKLEVGDAAPGTIRETVPLYGSISTAADRIHHVAARYPGVASRVSKKPGDPVKAGELLLTVESNDSLEPYRITAPAAGQVLERTVNNGESLGTQTLFVIGDLSTVWVELTLFPQDAQKLRVGQKVEVRSDNVDGTQAATIAFIGPAADGQRRSLIARVVLDNRDGRWAPGQLVAAEVVLAERKAGIVVPTAAVQSINGHNHVFVETAEGFEARAVTLGAYDSRDVEVLEGLKAGERIAVRNSYLLKAEWLTRSGA